MKNTVLNPQNASIETELDRLRLQQDAIDRELVQAIAKRVAIRRQISALRIAHDLPTIDRARIDYVLEQAETFALHYDVPPEMAREVFKVLIEWSHTLDREWRKEK